MNSVSELVCFFARIGAGSAFVFKQRRHWDWRGERNFNGFASITFILLENHNNWYQFDWNMKYWLTSNPIIHKIYKQVQQVLINFSFIENNFHISIHSFDVQIERFNCENNGKNCHVFFYTEAFTKQSKNMFRLNASIQRNFVLLLFRYFWSFDWNVSKFWLILLWKETWLLKWDLHFCCILCTFFDADAAGFNFRLINTQFKWYIFTFCENSIQIECLSTLSACKTDILAGSWYFYMIFFTKYQSSRNVLYSSSFDVCLWSTFHQAISSVNVTLSQNVNQEWSWRCWNSVRAMLETCFVRISDFIIVKLLFWKKKYQVISDKRNESTISFCIITSTDTYIQLAMKET